ncbi:DUF305 domain-containing protein [Flaviaesturariibacter amylovorans]|uniref:DUF305 domain-containing protein n=1 Tax=Flaviaesturariibacter amylovorans TaxID=1084520 RepID=A0ABP8HAR4_9BACT
MKKVFFTFGTVVALVACNSGGDNTTTTTSDTSTASTTQTTAPPPAAAPDTAGTAGKSMMGLMQANMEQMKAMPSTGNPDNDFAGLMKIHHMGAIEMAQLELAQGTDSEVKAMAQKMLDAQQGEVAQLNSFLSGHSAHGGGEAFYKEVTAGMGNMKMDMDHSGSVDKQFVQMMIPHHLGAIDMAKAYLKSGAHEAQLKTMANKIISDQQKEIQDLQGWLAKQ